MDVQGAASWSCASLTTPTAGLPSGILGSILSIPMTLNMMERVVHVIVDEFSHVHMHIRVEISTQYTQEEESRHELWHIHRNQQLKLHIILS